MHHEELNVDELRSCLGISGSREQRAKCAARAIRQRGNYRWVGLYDVGSSEISVIAWTITVERAELTDEVSRALIDSLNAELSARYPEPGATHFNLSAREVADRRGTFLVVKGCLP